jgi:hypothetical protein
MNPHPFLALECSDMSPLLANRIGVAEDYVKIVFCEVP